MAGAALACPRCAAVQVAVQHVAPHAAGTPPPWHVVHCAACSFTWRTTEPLDTVDPRCRPDIFQLDAARIAQLANQLPRLDRRCAS